MIQPVNYPLWSDSGIEVDMLRLDLLHPVVSGNKRFKLERYLEQAERDGKTGIASFGGPWSNHLHALAWAARERGLRSLGIVRGERPPHLSPTLADAEAWGMELVFASRQDYRVWSRLPSSPKAGMASAWPNGEDAGGQPPPFSASADYQSPTPEVRIGLPGAEDLLWIPEGGYGIPGAEGAASIWHHIPSGAYSHILCAVGTGTMMAGLLRANAPSLPPARIIGIPVLKAGDALATDIRHLLPPEMADAPMELLHEYHGGGYAKTRPELLDFMAAFYRETGIPTDIIYTGKLMYALDNLLRQGYFPAGSRLLAVHSGGLQGNRSLKSGILPYGQPVDLSLPRQ